MEKQRRVQPCLAARWVAPNADVEELKTLALWVSWVRIIQTFVYSEWC